MATENQVARLGIVVDSSQASTATLALNGMADAAKRAEDQQKKLTTESTKTSKPIKNIAETAKEAAIGIEKVSASTQNLSKVAQSKLEVSSSIQNIGSVSNKAATDVKNLSIATQDLTKNISKVSTTAPALVDPVKNTALSAEKATKSIDSLSASTKKIGGNFDTVKGNLETFDQGIKKVGIDTKTAANDVEGFGEKVRQGSEKTGSGFKKIADESKRLQINVKDVARELAEIFLPLATVGGAIAGMNSMRREAQQFGTALAEVSTLLDDTSPMAELEEIAKNISKEFGSLPTTQVKAFYEILSAGTSDVGKATEILTQANKLAIGGVATLDESIKGLNASMNAYKQENITATEVTDAFFIAAKAGSTNIRELSANIGDVAAVAASAGVAFDDLLAAASTITTGGVTTSQAMTQLRQLIISVLKPTDDAAKLAEQLGIEFNAAALKSKGLVNFLDDVQKKTGGSTEQLIRLFGSVDAFAGAVALTGPMASTFNNILEQMRNKAGATNIAYNKLADDMQNKTDQVAAKFAVLRIEIGKGLLETALPAIESLNENFDLYVDTVGLAVKITAAYLAALYAVPVASAVAAAAQVALWRAIALVSMQSTLAARNLLTLNTAAAAVAAAFIGWEIGKYARENFKEVELAGIAMASGVHKLIVALGGEFEVFSEEIKFWLTNPFSFGLNKFVDFFEGAANVMKAGLDALGFDEAAEGIVTDLSKYRTQAGNEQEKLLEGIRAATSKKVKEIDDEYAALFISATQTATVAKTAVKGLNEEIANVPNPDVPEVLDPESVNKLKQAYDSALDSYQRQIDLVGNLTEAQRLQFEIEKGELKGINDAQQRQLMTMAELIDAHQELIDLAEEKTKIDEEAQKIAERFDSSESIKRRYEKERDIILKSSEMTEEMKNDTIKKLAEKRDDDLLESSDDFWGKWLKSAEKNLQDFSKMSETVIDRFTSGFGDAFEEMAFDSKDFDDAMKDMTEGIARSVVNALGQMAAQWLAFQAVQLLVGKSTQLSAATAMTANAYATSLQAGLAAFASTAAIPIVGPAAAPAAMSAALAITTPVATSISSLSMAGMAHDGLMEVPKTGTWLLEKGERVTTEKTSKKLDRKLDEMGSGGTVQNFYIETSDANSFMYSETQIKKKMRRGLSS